MDELLIQLMAKDQPTLRSIYRSQSEGMFRALEQKYQGLTKAEFFKAYNEVFRDLLGKLSTFKGINQFYRALFKATKSKAIDNYRNSLTKKESPHSRTIEYQDYLHDVDIEIPAPKDERTRQLLRNKLIRAIAALPDQQRLIIEMYLDDDLELPAIARKLKRQYTTVFTQFKRAQQKLNEELSPYANRETWKQLFLLFLAWWFVFSTFFKKS